MVGQLFGRSSGYFLPQIRGVGHAVAFHRRSPGVGHLKTNRRLVLEAVTWVH